VQVHVSRSTTISGSTCADIATSVLFVLQASTTAAYIVSWSAAIFMIAYPCILAVNAYSHKQGFWAIIRALTSVEMGYR
jgi:hypothetical protein